MPNPLAPQPRLIGTTGGGGRMLRVYRQAHIVTLTDGVALGNWQMRTDQARELGELLLNAASDEPQPRRP